MMFVANRDAVMVYAPGVISTLGGAAVFIVDATKYLIFIRR